MMVKHPVPDSIRDTKHDGVQLTITRQDPAADPHSPSHFFPGCGTSGATFQITAGRIPSEGELQLMLEVTLFEVYLTNYDNATGSGYLQVVDDDLPAAGTIIDLLNPFTDPDKDIGNL